MNVKPIEPFNNPNPNLWKWVLAVLIAIVAFIVLTSCSSSKKFKSKETEKKETIETINEHLVNVKNVDSSSLLYEDSSFTNNSTLKVEFDNGFDVPTDGEIVTDEKENDYDGAAPKKIKIPAAVTGKTTRIDFTYNINGTIITSPVPIKNIKLIDKNTGKVTAVEVKKNITSDSSAATTNAVTQTKTERTSVTKNKKTISWAWLWISIICIVAVAIVLRIPIVQRFTRPFFALFKNKKEDRPPPPASV